MAVIKQAYLDAIHARCTQVVLKSRMPQLQHGPHGVYKSNIKADLLYAHTESTTALHAVSVLVAIKLTYDACPRAGVQLRWNTE